MSRQPLIVVPAGNVPFLRLQFLLFVRMLKMLQMLASIKLYLKILAALGFLAALAVVLLVAAWVNLPQRIEIQMKGACPSIEKSDFRYIDFLGLEMGVPSKIFTECFAYAVHDGLDIDPATIVLDAELPNFTPLKGIDQRSPP